MTKLYLSQLLRMIQVSYKTTWMNLPESLKLMVPIEEIQMQGASYKFFHV